MFLKPSQMKKKPVAVRVFRDGREVCNFNCKAGRDEYANRKRAMWERQGRCCYLCGKYLPLDELTFDHEFSRGGGKRDDRIVKDGKRLNGAAHWLCNQRKGSMILEKFLDMEIVL